MTKYIFTAVLFMTTTSLSAQKNHWIFTCVIDSGKLKSVQVAQAPDGKITLTLGGKQVTYDPAAPDDFPGYAAKQEWYVKHEPIEYNGKSYVTYGLPRVLSVNDIEKVGEYKGIGVYGESANASREVIYIPVQIGCEFQPYQKLAKKE